MGATKEPVRLLRGGELTVLHVDDMESIGRVCGGTDDSCFVEAGNTLWRLQVAYNGDAVACRKFKVLELPENVVEWDACWTAAGPVVSTIEDRHPKPDPNAAIVYPAPQRDLTLLVYRPAEGWVEVSSSIPRESECLAISGDGQRAAWRVMKNPIPEEAERGEFWVASLTDGGLAQPLTTDAGRVGSAILSPNGDVVLFTANMSLTHPITTSMQLFVASFPSGKPVAVPDDGCYVQDFDWITTSGEPTTLAVTRLEGVKQTSVLYSLDAIRRKATGAATGTDAKEMAVPIFPCASTSSFGETFLYGSESVTEYPYLLSSSIGKIELGQDPELDDITVSVFEWPASDGTLISGVLAETTGTPITAPLLVHAHGGPAIPLPALRFAGAGATRYPYRHFLKAGYRVFCPSFRGTLGFGDKFAQGNIRKQGHLHGGDLGDINSGIDYLVSSGRLDAAVLDKLGIFGGSYGGYMTMRAMGMLPDRFKAGIAMYGFVHNRWMSLEGGDFTYETEYIGPQEWPLTEEHQASDNLQILANIKNPCLFMHGANDDICPLSQSFVGYRVLTTQGVPTGMVTYPGEGHGFDKPENRRDRDRRALEWFGRYLPV